MSLIPTHRPFEMRVIGERAELTTRLFSLAQFLASPLLVKVDAEEITRLRAQHTAMGQYLKILDERIAAFPPVEEEIDLNNPGPRGHEKSFPLSGSNMSELWPNLVRCSYSEPPTLSSCGSTATGLAVFKEEVPVGAAPIEDVNTFAMMVDHWHAQCMERGNRVLEIPEGTTIEVEDQQTPGQTIEMDLNGPYLQVFRVGVMTVLHLFKDLPFGASIEDASGAPANDPAAA